MIVEPERNCPVSALTKIGTKPALLGRLWRWLVTVSTASCWKHQISKSKKQSNTWKLPEIHKSHKNFQYLVLWVTSCISKIPELQLDCRDLWNWAIRSPTRCMCTMSQQINIWIWNVRSWIKGWQKTFTQINLKSKQFLFRADNCDRLFAGHHN